MITDRRLSTSATTSLPTSSIRSHLLKNSGNKLLKTTLGGWEVSGIVTAITGAPLNIGVTGQNVCSVVPNCSNRPDVTGPLSNPHTVNEWFDTAAFTMPAATSVSTVGRYPITMSAGRAGKTGTSPCSRTSCSTRNAAPICNSARSSLTSGTIHNGSATPSTAASALTSAPATSARVTSAYDPREIQLALKFTF